MDFFDGGHLPQGFGTTSIILIPKKDGACRWTDFRPISLCTIFNKIIAKPLNTRLSSLPLCIISPLESGFITGRLIRDNVLLAQEMLYALDDKVRGGNTILKLDMTTTYDCMDRNFIYSVLKAFGLIGLGDTF